MGKNVGYKHHVEEGILHCGSYWLRATDVEAIGEEKAEGRWQDTAIDLTKVDIIEDTGFDPEERKELEGKGRVIFSSALPMTTNLEWAELLQVFLEHKRAWRR